MATVREHYDTSAKALNAQRHWDLGSKVDSVIVRIWGKVSHCLEENAKYWSFYFPERAEIGCIYYLLSQPHVSDGVISHDEPEQEIGFAHTPERQTLSSFIFTRRVYIYFDEIGDSHLGRVFHKQVNVIVLAVHLDQLRLEVGADLGEDRAQPVDGVAIEYPAAIFRYKDQMDMHLKNAVSSMPNIVVVAHGPNYNIRMQRLQAFKYELRPDGQQERQMRRFAGSCRFVYNKGLALQKERYERGEKKLGYAGLCKLLTEWRNSAETAWLADAPVHPLQQALKDLERAYSNFFAKRADFPRFKKKGQRDSFRYPDPKQIKLDQANSCLFLPKLGWLRYRNSREVLGTVKNITVSQSCGKWFVSIQTEREIEQPIPQGGAVGIDMGIVRFATLSDGTFYAPLNSFKRHETALRKAQQAMSRKTKFSNNWKKAKARVQRIHSRIGNARRDFLHKTSTAISQNHAMVCIEDLQVRNMSRSAAGTTEQPGRNVRAKSGLNKSILDQGWFEFRRQLDYKLAWQGGWLVAVPPQNTSRTCPCCGHVSAENRQTQARFACVECGFEENADVVGAINVLRAGHARFACEVSGAVMPPAAGTHRSDSGAALSRP